MKKGGFLHIGNAAVKEALQEAPKKKKTVKKEKQVKKKKKKRKKKVPSLIAEVVTTSLPTPTVEDIDFFNVVYNVINFDNLPKDPNELPNPEDLIEKAIDANFDMGVFADHKFPEAANIIDWIISPSYLNCSTKPYAKQFQVITHFNRDVCYSCSDLDYIFDVPVDANYGELMERFVLLEYGICPVCKRNRTEMLEEWIVDPKFYKYNDYGDYARSRLRPVPPNELCAIWGQRSGKSHSASTFVATYHIHRYLALENPMAYFDEPANKIVSGTFVSPTLKQSSEFSWVPFCDALRSSPWFKSMVSYLKDEGKRLGLELFQSGQTFLTFPSKRLALSMAAANSSNLRGKTGLINLIDELGWFNYDDQGKKRRVRDGSAIFRSLTNNLRTLRAAADIRRRNGDYNAIDAIMANISSPSSIGDPIMQRAEVAAKNPRIYYTHFATWEVNPKQTEEAIRDEFAGEPEEDILRDFYAIPPKASSPFFKDQTLLEDLTYEMAEPEPAFTYVIKEHESDLGLQTLRPEVTIPKNSSNSMYAYVVAVDNGEKKNSFALTLARYLPELDGTYFEEFMEVAPRQARSVDLAWAYEHVIVPLVNSFNVLYVGYDIWQSAHDFYDLRTKHDVISERYSLTFNDFKNFRHDLGGNKIRFNNQDSDIDSILGTRDIAMRSLYPRSHCLAQILTVNVFNRKLFKPDIGNDDLFRTAVLAHRFIRNYKKEFEKKSKIKFRRAGIEAMGFKRANNPVPGSFTMPRAWFGPGNSSSSSLRGARRTQQSKRQIHGNGRRTRGR